MTYEHDDIEEPEEVDDDPRVALVRRSADFSDALPVALDPELAQLIDAMATYAAAQAPNTTKAYESDWRQFERWVPAPRPGRDARIAVAPSDPDPVAREASS